MTFLLTFQKSFKEVRSILILISVLTFGFVITATGGAPRGKIISTDPPVKTDSVDLKIDSIDVKGRCWKCVNVLVIKVKRGDKGLGSIQHVWVPYNVKSMYKQKANKSYKMKRISGVGRKKYDLNMQNGIVLNIIQ